MYQWILNKGNFAYCRLDYHNTSIGICETHRLEFVNLA